MSSVAKDILGAFLAFAVLPTCVLAPPIFAYREWRATSPLTFGEWALVVLFAFMGFGIFANIVIVLQSVGIY